MLTSHDESEPFSINQENPMKDPSMPASSGIYETDSSIVARGAAGPGNDTFKFCTIDVAGAGIASS